MDEHGGSGASDLSLEDLMDEYSSRPSQIAEWLWCIEYVAKFVKDIHCILDLMNMGYQYSNDYGERINEVLSLRVLEFMFDSRNNDSDSTGVGVASTTSEEKIEFDLSLSNADVLRAILKEIPVTELRVGMPELSKFNVLPFIAHKNMCLPQCALEKLRDASQMENQTSVASYTEADDPVFGDDRSVHVDTRQEEQIDEQQVHINEKEKVIAIDDEDEPMHTDDEDEVIVIDDDTESDQDTTGEHINNGVNTWSEHAPVRCTNDGTWLISGSDNDESDMDKDTAFINKNPNTYMDLLPSSSRTRPENVCWKCKKEGTLLICSRSECAAKIHEECLKCPVNVDEEGNFHCPLCWYNRVTMEYHECEKLMSGSKRVLVKCFPVLSTRSKRLK